MLSKRRAKILCTIGPASRSPETLGALIDAGLNGARMNFSHGSKDDHRATYEAIRDQARSREMAITVLADLQGPKIRVGQIPDPGLELVEGASLVLTVDADDDPANARLAVDYPRLASEARPGEPILLDDGNLELVIESIEGNDLHTRVITGGTLTSRKGVNLPQSDLSIPAMTQKDEEDLAFALELGVDMVALSFVRTPSDLEQCRDLMRKADRVVPLIAKVEKPEAVDNLDAIVDCADGVMVARGDLGVEMGPEEVPIIQKRLIEACNRQGKLVITATQMLDSMIRNPRPTRAEASDVANAVLDGTDATMLSGETAAGRYPIESVATMDRITRQTESADRHWAEAGLGTDLDHSANAIARAAVSSSKTLSDCRAIIAYTGSGGTARLISAYRPRVPIFAFTPEISTYNSLGLYWGITPVHFSPSTEDGEHIFEDLDRAIVDRGLFAVGDLVVIAMGWPIKAQTSVNLLKVHRIGKSLPG